MRIRTGVGNRVVFNQTHFRYGLQPYWLYFILAGWVTSESSVLELGSGAGRSSLALRVASAAGGYSGSYTGIDVDPELVDWCQRNYPPNFRFLTLDVHTKAYNPAGEVRGSFELPVADSSQDFVLAMSLFTHLLEDDLGRYLEEAYRVTRPGARLFASVFCVEHMSGRLGSRWTFAHRIGAAHVESRRIPEAAVAYSEEWLLRRSREAGFAEASLPPMRTGQSLLWLVK